ncbi:FecR family protein [Sanguibacteroides justesenii]|uniref:FecR family protein n=1 Tax=Sanguibacteroides justesenii TaxID=1547597 RepID=UPI0015E8A7AC|nr:FecR domain-containing protein [Sanguibacteroides justesenii]
MKKDLNETIEERIRLIKHYLDGTLTPEEEKALRCWIEESPTHSELLYRIQDKSSLQKRFHFRKKENKEKSWNTIRKRIYQKPKRKIVLTRYAAILLIGVCLGIGYKFIMEPQTKDTTITRETVIPPKGGYKAFLKLANGEHYVLDGQTEINTRLDGAIIQSEDQGIVTVTKDSGSTEREAQNNQIIVPKGGEYKLILADGTRVWMNSLSELEFPSRFTGKERRIKLNGEAYFEVVKDKEKPFIVEMGDNEIKVLGTSFNINNYDGSFVTTLVTGKVEIVIKKQGYLLHPSMQLREENGKVTLSKVDTKEFVAWKDGWFVFNKQRLEEVLNILSRWYDVEINYKTPEVKDLHFTGTIRRHSDINEMLNFLEKTGAIKFTMQGRTVVISK